jgi:large subunit ribosomal protein L17
MRHRMAGKKLGRNFNERKALLRSLTRAMFTHGSIETTEAKVKSVHAMVENLANIIISKEELTVKRELFKVLQDQHWVNRVVSNFKSVFGDQTSNFTTVKKIKHRFGDDALIVKYSFVKAVNFQPEKVEVDKKANKKILSKAEGKKEKVAKKIKAVKKESK